jgi:DNA-binding NarL/FixJ family response regulator
MRARQALRVVVAEDSAVIRAGIVEVLADRGHQVSAAVGDGASLVEAVAEYHPDVVIIDVRMPPTYTDEGLRAALALRHDHPRLPVLVFSQYVETRHLAELLSGGSPRSAAGVGYLLKDRVADVGEFIDALARVAGGGTALDPEVISELIGASGRSRALESLTPREREVLALMAEGRSNAAIAQHLVVSERAIQKHVSSIFLKLDLPPSDADHRRVLAVLEYLRS